MLLGGDCFRSEKAGRSQIHSSTFFNATTSIQKATALESSQNQIQFSTDAKLRSDNPSRSLQTIKGRSQTVVRVGVFIRFYTSEAGKEFTSKERMQGVFFIHVLAKFAINNVQNFCSVNVMELVAEHASRKIRDRRGRTALSWHGCKSAHQIL